MKIPEKTKREGLAEYAERLSELYYMTSDVRLRKQKGQFFTPKQVSTFMADLLEIRHDEIRLLDPGAGTGVLSAAFCERLLGSNKRVHLVIDAYENDPNLVPLLETVLESCRIALRRKGHKVEYNIYEQDFILHNQRHFGKPDVLWPAERHVAYDCAMSNPPYYKLSKKAPQSRVMMGLVSGQPNIYALFMALSASMLKPEGEMVFITPRSFCSGLYFKKFRQWFLNTVQITNIHIFESRKEVFHRDQVLQENIIIRAKKTRRNERQQLVVSASRGKDFAKSRRVRVRFDDAICRRNDEVFIRIPASPLDVDILHAVGQWPNTLASLGLEISTGPVVPFRAKTFLVRDSTDDPGFTPLLWMHNMQGMRVVWPLRKSKKASAIRTCYRAQSLLLPVKNYVLVKRFSSKEQKRRLQAAVLLESEFAHDTVGIENHVNYVYRPGGSLSVYEALGIAAILNTAIIDNFFRSVNGNTQVNATDVRSLPLPDIKQIREIGRVVYQTRVPRIGFDLDGLVADILGIDGKIMRKLHRDMDGNEQS